MLLTLHRQPSFEDTTLGTLFVNGVYQCATLEDVVRPEGEKVYGKTAIPAGRYRLTITLSNRFKAPMPLVCGVPGFEGVRIHPGNTAEQTDGCILVGTVSDARTIIDSRAAFEALMPVIRAGDGEAEGCWIEVREAVEQERAAEMSDKPIGYETP